MSRSKSVEDAPSKSKLEVRADIISYIRNERDTVLKKWMALEESVNSEDRQREEFYARIERSRTKIVPPTVQKFIGTLKKAVRGIIRNKGGTVFSIIRGMFIYWDKDRMGGITESGLKGVMNTLGVVLSVEDKEAIMAYYRKGKGTGQMNYMELLRDVQRGEPNALVFVDQKEEKEKDSKQERFKDIWDVTRVMPPRVQQFLEATQEYIMQKLRWEGSTPEYHLRHIFHFYDYSCSGGLTPTELATAASKGMNFKVSIQDCEEVVDYYDMMKTGQMTYDAYIKDVMSNVKPVFHHVFLEEDELKDLENSLAQNPFIRRPFKAPDNKVLQDYQRKIFTSAANKVNAHGGSVRYWIKEAFASWDNKLYYKFTDPESLVGVSKRLGVHISREDALIIMKCYDRYNRGEMHYLLFIDDMNGLDPHFSKDISFVKPHPRVTEESYTPNQIEDILRKIKASAEMFARKSKGHVSPKDVLLGTFIRFDSGGKQKSGKVTVSGVKSAMDTLKCTNISDNDISQLIIYFDNNATGLFDYNLCIESLYGTSDVTTKTLVLPKLGMNNSMGLTVTMRTAHQELMRNSTAPSPLLGDLSLRDTSDLTSSQKKNLDVIESVATKFQRNKKNRKIILSERERIMAKIDDIESQQRYIIDDYNQRKPRVQQI